MDKPIKALAPAWLAKVINAASRDRRFEKILDGAERSHGTGAQRSPRSSDVRVSVSRPRSRRTSMIAVIAEATAGNPT